MQNLERLTLAEMQEFLAGSRSIGFRVEGREQIYRFVERVLAAQHYRRLGKRQKGIVRRFLARLSGLSRAQLTRLMGQWLRHRRIEARQPRRHRYKLRGRGFGKTEPPIRTAQDPLKNQTLQGLSKHRLHGGEGTFAVWSTQMFEKG